MRDIKFRAWREGLGMYAWDVTGTFNSDEYYQCLESIHPLMQYLGVNDENDKPICEGDIVKDNWHIKVVEYDETGWEPFMYCGGGEMEPESCEIIGNIYENPELLEKLK